MINETLYLMKKYNIIQQGEFTLKNGEKSNIYVNLKNIISHPDLLNNICILLKDKIIKDGYSDFVLCGVPYGGIPISTGISLKMNVGQIMLRKERKTYGTKKLIEGDDNIDNVNNVILIEDVVTTGSSLLETIEILKENNFNVIKSYSIVNRGNCDIENYDYLFSLKDICFNIKIPKIIVAFDFNDIEKLKNIINNASKYISGIKVHNEILNLSKEENMELYQLCKKNDIFLWEDRKFNDIANTVEKQLKYYENIRDHISIVPTSGIDILKIKSKLGKFVLCEMSSKNNLFQNINIMKTYNDLNEGYNICGVICQNPELFPNYTTIMPGINILRKTDNMGQEWRNPKNIKNKPDYYVIGRNITLSDDPVKQIIFIYNYLRKF